MALCYFSPVAPSTLRLIPLYACDGVISMRRSTLIKLNSVVCVSSSMRLQQEHGFSLRLWVVAAMPLRLRLPQ